MRFRPPEKRYAGYIFDCDGTLVESMPLHFAAWRSALTAAGAPFEFTWELFYKRAGMTLEQTVTELNAQFLCNIDSIAVAAEQRKSYRASLGAVAAVQPVLEFAQSLRGRAPLSVASGGNREDVRKSLEAVDAAGLFDPVVTACDVTRGKPHPEMFLRCAERMGVEPSDCLVVEDGQLGIEGAERAGMDWVRVGPTTDF